MLLRAVQAEASDFDFMRKEMIFIARKRPIGLSAKVLPISAYGRKYIVRDEILLFCNGLHVEPLLTSEFSPGRGE